MSQARAVVDATILPTVPGGNTNAAVIMAGEKVSDLVRGRQLTPAELSLSTVAA